MMGDWREFTVSADACPARQLDPSDLEHLQNNADKSKRIHDAVIVYDEEDRLVSMVFQMDSITPGVAAIKATENMLALFSSIGIRGERVRIDAISAEPITTNGQFRELSREDFV